MLWFQLIMQQEECALAVVLAEVKVAKGRPLKSVLFLIQADEPRSALSNLMYMLNARGRIIEIR